MRKQKIDDLRLLDLELLHRYQEEVGSESKNEWQFLRDNGLALVQDEKNFLSNAGALLFAKNPTVTLAHKCSIKISHYYGTKPSYSIDPNFVRRPFSVEGPLLIQIEKAVEYFRNVVASSPPKLRGPGFRPSFLIPEGVFQEAVTNAVIHRNYSVENDIQIRFFDDRVEVESPGTYPGHINVSNIRRERYARNPLILRTLNRFRAAPNLDIGEGVDRMFASMLAINLYEPLFVPPSISPRSVHLILLNLHKVEYWDTVSHYLDEKGRITNSEARKITGIHDILKMSRLLSSWVDKKLLAKALSTGKKNVFYIKPGQDIISGLFSLGTEKQIGRNPKMTDSESLVQESIFMKEIYAHR